MRNICFFAILVDVSRFSPRVIHLSRNKNICCGLKKKYRRSTLGHKFWLCCSFFSRLTTCHETNLLMLRGKLRVFVSRISPPSVRRRSGGRGGVPSSPGLHRNTCIQCSQSRYTKLLLQRTHINLPLEGAFSALSIIITATGILGSMGLLSNTRLRRT